MEGAKLECSECGERYARGEHCPRSLFCGHVFCTSCLDRLIASESPRCPTCGRPFISFSASQLPTDFSLLRRATAKATGNRSRPLGSNLDVSSYNSPSPLSSSTYRSKSLDAMSSSSSKPLSSSLSPSRITKPSDSSSAYLSSSSYLSKGLGSSSHRSKPLDYASSTNYKRISTSIATSSPPASQATNSLGNKGLRLPLIGSTSPTFTSLTPRLSSSPTIISASSGHSERSFPSSSQVASSVNDNSSSEYVVVESPHSTTSPTTSSENLAQSETKMALDIKLPTIRTRLNIMGNQDDKSSDDVHAKTVHDTVVTTHAKQKETSPRLNTSTPDVVSSRVPRTPAGYYSATNTCNSSVTGESSHLTKLPTILNSGEKQKSSEDKSSSSFPATSHSELSTNSKVLSTTPPHNSSSSAKSLWTLPSLEKLNTKLNSSVSDAKPPVDEVDHSVSGWKIDIKSSGLRSSDSAERKSKGTASKTPDHMLKMCRSITARSQSLPNSRDASVRGPTKRSSSTDLQSSPVSLLASEASSNKEDNSSSVHNSYRDSTSTNSLNAHLTSAADSYLEEKNKQKTEPKRTDSGTIKRDTEIATEEKSNLSEGSFGGTKAATATHTRESDLQETPTREDVRYLSDQDEMRRDSINQYSTPTNHNSQHRSETSSGSPKTVPSGGGADQELKSGVTETEKKRNSTRTLIHSKSKGSDPPDGETEIKERSDELKLARSSSLSARLRARTSFISDTIDEEREDESKAENRRSAEKNVLANKNTNLTTSPTSLKARISSRTNFIPRAPSLDDKEGDSTIFQQLNRGQTDASAAGTNAADPDMKLIRRSWMKMRRLKGRDLYQDGVHPYSTTESLSPPTQEAGEHQDQTPSKQSVETEHHTENQRKVLAKDDDLDAEDEIQRTPPSLPLVPPPSDDEVNSDTVCSDVKHESSLHHPRHTEKRTADSQLETNPDVGGDHNTLQRNTASDSVPSQAASHRRKYGSQELSGSDIIKSSSRQQSLESRGTMANSLNQTQREERSYVATDFPDKESESRLSTKTSLQADKSLKPQAAATIKSSSSSTLMSRSSSSGDVQSGDKEFKAKSLLPEGSSRDKLQTASKSSASSSWMSRSSLTLKHRRASLDPKLMSSTETPRPRQADSDNKSSGKSHHTQRRYSHRIHDGYECSSDSEMDSNSSNKVTKTFPSSGTSKSSVQNTKRSHTQQKVDTESKNLRTSYDNEGKKSSALKGRLSNTTRQQGRTSYHSRITDIDQLLDLEVGEVPSIQEGSNADSEGASTEEEDDLSSAREASSGQQEVLHQDRKMEETADHISRGITSKTCSKSSDTTQNLSMPLRKTVDNEELKKSSVSTDDSTHTSTISPRASSKNQQTVSWSTSRETAPDTVDSPQQTNPTRNETQDETLSPVNQSSRDLWRAKNKKIRDYLASRPTRTRHTSAEMSEETEAEDPVARLRRARYNLRNTVSTEPPQKHSTLSSSSRRRRSTPQRTEGETVSSPVGQAQMLDQTKTRYEDAENAKTGKMQNMPRYETAQVLPTPVMSQAVHTTGGADNICYTNVDQEKRLHSSEADATEGEASNYYPTVDDDDTLVMSKSAHLNTDNVEPSCQEGTAAGLAYEADEGEEVDVGTDLYTLQKELLSPNTRQDLGFTFQQLTEAWSTNHMNSMEVRVEEKPGNYRRVDAADGPMNFPGMSDARPGIGLCSTHGLLLHLYCQVCQEWVCDGCVDMVHPGPPYNECLVIPATDTILQMKMAHTEFLSSRVDMLDYFRGELRKLLADCDHSIREHQTRMGQLNLKLKEEVTMLKGIRSMKGLVLQKWQQIDQWEELLRQNAARIHQSSSSQEVMSAVQVNRQNILSNIMEGITPPPASNVDFSLPPDVLY